MVYLQLRKIRNHSSHHPTDFNPYLSSMSDASDTSQMVPSVLAAMSAHDHENVQFFHDPETGLKAIIAVHDTTLGPSLGGTRMWPYATEAEALHDVLRLSRGMTYKAAISGLAQGGGKAVIIGNSRTDKSEALFRAFGRCVNRMGGSYITAEDVGMDEENMAWIRQETSYVTGLPKAMGGSGDPSPFTALGVYMSMKASMKYRTGSDGLAGKKIAIQGAGHVASYLAKHLQKEGAKLFISDIFEEKAQHLASEVGAEVVQPEKILSLDVDILSPCALGGVINDETIPELACEFIVGGANNILWDEVTHGQALKDKDILFAPDYVVNAGGIINISNEIGGYNPEKATEQTQAIYHTLLEVFHYASEKNMTPNLASNELVEQRLKDAKK